MSKTSKRVKSTRSVPKTRLNINDSDLTIPAEKATAMIVDALKVLHPKKKITVEVEK